MVKIDKLKTLLFIRGLSYQWYRWPEDMKAFEYSVLATNLEADVVSVVQYYRDRAD